MSVCDLCKQLVIAGSQTPQLSDEAARLAEAVEKLTWFVDSEDADVNELHAWAVYWLDSRST